MPVYSDAIDDTMADRIENKIRDLLMANNALDPIKFFALGEPGELIPVPLFPYFVIFVSREAEAIGEEGFEEETGPIRAYRYDGYLTCSVLVPDARSIRPTLRKVDVASYKASKKFIQAAKQSLMNWAGPSGEMTGAPIVSQDGQETSWRFAMDGVTNGLQTRGQDNASNESGFEFHVFTRRDESI